MHGHYSVDTGKGGRWLKQSCTIPMIASASAIQMREMNELHLRRTRNVQRVPRFCSSGDHAMPLHEYPGALLYWVFGWYWRARGYCADGFQRVV